MKPANSGTKALADLFGLSVVAIAQEIAWRDQLHAIQQSRTTGQIGSE